MSKRRGVGYQIPAGSRAVWVGASSVLDSPVIDLSATTFEGRYGHKDAFGSPQGMANENFGNNEKALLNWYAAQPAAHRELWDGIPTGPLGQDAGPADQWEQWDLAFTESQTGSSFYQQHWWAYEPGGTPETAVVVDESNWVEHGGKFPRGVALGLQTKPGPIPGYDKWYDVRWKPAGFPDPAPPPKVGTAAEFYKQGERFFVKGKVKSISGTKIKFMPDAGGSSVEHDLDDEGRRWWLLAAPAPTPAPSPPPPTPPAPTPPPPKPPEPKPEPIPPPAAPDPFSEDAMRTFDLAPKWPELAGKPGKVARLSRLAREAQRIQTALLAAKDK